MRDVMDTMRVLAPAAANIIVVLIGIAFAVMAVGCLIYAMSSGHFREIEEAKYRMLDAEDEDWKAQSGSRAPRAAETGRSATVPAVGVQR